MGAFDKDPNDLVVSTGDRLVLNLLLQHDFLSEVQLDNVFQHFETVPLS